jgi:hypothetical protein
MLKNLKGREKTICLFVGRNGLVEKERLIMTEEEGIKKKRKFLIREEMLSTSPEEVLDTSREIPWD